MSDSTPVALPPCPDRPNCVSSQAPDAEHFVEPLRFDGPPDVAWRALRRALLSQPRIRIERDTGAYLHAEARSRLFRFVDDVQMLLVAGERLIHMRSASRVGHSDLGVNRKRLERLRADFAVALAAADDAP